jgi:Raf kinase inhibitor-like YbhB/YbcL family protein
MKKFFIILIIFLVVVGLATVIITWPKQATAPTVNQPPEKINNMMLISSAFADGQAIPDLYGCKGQNIKPPLVFKDVPAGAKSLALIVDDPDAPSGDWVHWLVWNIGPQTTGIDAASVPTGATEGKNDFGNNNYGGPCPPFGTHHYHFTLYVLDSELNLPLATNKAALLKALDGHILAQTQLIGTYSH